MHIDFALRYKDGLLTIGNTLLKNNLLQMDGNINLSIYDKCYIHSKTNKSIIACRRLLELVKDVFLRYTYKHNDEKKFTNEVIKTKFDMLFKNVEII